MACTTSFTLSFISLPLFHFLSGTFVISFPFPPFPNPFVCSSPLTHTLSPSCSHSLASLIVCLFHFPSLLFFFPHFINSFFFISSPFRTLSYSASFSKITHTLSLLLLFFISRVCVCARAGLSSSTQGEWKTAHFFPALITTPNLFHGQHAVGSSFTHHSNCHLHVCMRLSVCNRRLARV